MSGSGGKIKFSMVTVLLACFCTVGFFCWSIAAIAGEPSAGIGGITHAETMRMGENIYRKGILPSGKPVTAMVQGDTPVEGTMFSCESCHMRSGLGSLEGGVVTTPTDGTTLYTPQFTTRQLTPAEMEKMPRYLAPLYLVPPRRPAYTDKTLAVALQEGVDPGGRRLHPVMPRYFLDDRDMKILVNYLKSLSAEPSAGVTETTIRFATVVTDKVSPGERDAVLAPLEKYVRGRNSKVKTFETRAKYGFFAESMDLSYRRLSLSRWELRGPPETWRSQLEEYYRKEPVFAILGGITNGEWQPVHDFSEEHRIPCILPITDLPVISETAWYTLYFSKGLYQEGEAVARHLGMTIEIPPDKRVVQIFHDNREGRALSAGFQETWQEFGRQPPVNRTLKEGENITQEFLQKLVEKERPAVIILWAGPEALPVLETIAASANRPEMVYLSSTLLQQSLVKLPDNVRGFTYLTYPYALPLESSRLSPNPAKAVRAATKVIIAEKMRSLSLILTDALMMMGSNYYRDRFLEVIDMMQDQPRPYTNYERLSFGPGQRYAAKGCYIVQLGKGPNPELIRKSDWVIH